MGTKVTHEMFVSEVFNLVGNEYTILGVYTKAKENLDIKHNDCGHEYQVTPDNFKRGRRCPQCANNIKRKEGKVSNIDSFKKSVYELVGNEYSVLDDSYINARTPIKIKHNYCGYGWSVRPNHFTKNGTRCPECSNKESGLSRRKSIEEFKKEVDDVSNSEYEVVGEYVNAMTKVKMKHISCGATYKVEPNSFLNGNRCPECNKRNSMSKGETRIKDFLEINQLKYVYQYTFEDCKNIFVLPFDFAILNSDGDVVLIIEFDGRQHYEVVEIWGGEKEFERIKMCDNIKNNYCKDNNIPLVRIPHWEYENIERILNESLGEGVK